MSKAETLAVLHEPFVKRFTFSDGKVIAKCSVVGCHYGTGHLASPSTGNLYSTKHTAVGEMPDMPIVVGEDEWGEIDRLAAELAVDARPSGPKAGPEPEVEVENLDGTREFVPVSELETETADDIDDDPTFEESGSRVPA